MTSLSLYEDLLAPGETLELARGGRIVYVASGELATLHAGHAAFGAEEVVLAAGVDGATVLRWELTEWSVDDAKLSAHIELDPWADYAMRCERDGGAAAGPGIGCVLRGELMVDGELGTALRGLRRAGGACGPRLVRPRRARARGGLERRRGARPGRRSPLSSVGGTRSRLQKGTA